MGKIKCMAALIATLSIAGPATASVIRTVDLNFASGAAFSGIVTFANDFSSYSAVSGILRGYGYGGSSYNPTATDSINWVWSAHNFVSGPHAFSNFLMDGTNNSNYRNWITFGYHYNPSGISVFKGGRWWGNANNVDYTDRLTRASVKSVPEPATFALFGLGLAGIAFARFAFARSPSSLQLRCARSLSKSFVI